VTQTTTQFDSTDFPDLSPVDYSLAHAKCDACLAIIRDYTTPSLAANHIRERFDSLQNVMAAEVIDAYEAKFGPWTPAGPFDQTLGDLQKQLAAALPTQPGTAPSCLNRDPFGWVAVLPDLDDNF
jgi:hypothetical protein